MSQPNGNDQNNSQQHNNQQLIPGQYDNYPSFAQQSALLQMVFQQHTNLPNTPPYHSNHQMMPEQYGSYQIATQQHGLFPTMPRQYATFNNAPPLYSNQQTASSSYGHCRRLPRYSRNRPTPRRDALEQSLEASMRNPILATPFRHRRAVERFLGREVPEFESLIIDHDVVTADQRAEQRALSTRRLNKRRAKVNLEVNNSVQNPLHFLKLPLEIRLKIYDLLINGPRVTLTSEASQGVHGAHYWNWQFKADNIPLNILVVCQEIHEEVLRLLFTKLAIDVDPQSPKFDEAVPWRAQCWGQEVWNMQPHFAYSVFSSMTVWVRSETYIINSGLWTEFTNLNSKQMFTDAVGHLDGSKIPGKDFLELVRAAPRRQHVAFFGKVNLLCCYKMVGGPLVRVARGRPICGDKHESMGHVYLDFWKERAIFDRADVQGHDACIMALRRM